MTRKQIAFDLDTRALSPLNPLKGSALAKVASLPILTRSGLRPTAPERATLDPTTGLCPEPRTRREAEGQGSSLSLAGKCIAPFRQGTGSIFFLRSKISTLKPLTAFPLLLNKCCSCAQWTGQVLSAHYLVYRK